MGLGSADEEVGGTVFPSLPLPVLFYRHSVQSVTISETLRRRQRDVVAGCSIHENGRLASIAFGIFLFRHEVVARNDTVQQNTIQ